MKGAGLSLIGQCNRPEEANILVVRNDHAIFLNRPLISATSMVPQPGHSFTDKPVSNTWVEGAKRHVFLHHGSLSLSTEISVVALTMLMSLCPLVPSPVANAIQISGTDPQLGVLSSLFGEYGLIPLTKTAT